MGRLETTCLDRYIKFVYSPLTLHLPECSFSDDKRELNDFKRGVRDVRIKVINVSFAKLPAATNSHSLRLVVLPLKPCDIIRRASHIFFDAKGKTLAYVFGRRECEMCKNPLPGRRFTCK